MISAISELLVDAENLGWKNVSMPWWERLGTARPCFRLLRAGLPPTIDALLSSYVQRRNDGIGHGIPGNYDPEAEIDLLKLLIERLGGVLPKYLSASNRLFVSAAGTTAEIVTLRLAEGDPILYREIKSLGATRARVTAQVLRSDFTSEPLVYECEDVIGMEPALQVDELFFNSTYDVDWNPLGRVPDRPTLEFEGREVEFARLQEWFADEGSRSCLVYGDGGNGKTTFLVEFLHRVMEGQIKTEWKPDAIFYYTAKQTQWTVDGIKYIGVPRVGLSDALRAIVSSVEGSLSRDWFFADISTLANKVKGFLSSLGLKRENVLLVVDNAETLARSEADIDRLVDECNITVRQVGRMILTSRRRERLEARQLKIEPLPEDDAVRMMRARGVALNRRQIVDAGDPKLRQYAQRLGFRPLAIEVFVSAVEPGLSLDHAFNRVARLQEAELGDFLYSDAWDRLKPNVRVLLLLMARVSDVHDEVLLKLACQECGVTVREAEDALQESLGIASITRSAGHLTIAFADEFRRFCESKHVLQGGAKKPDARMVERVNSRYSTYLKAVNSNFVSKDARAFRHALARAAYAAASDGRVDDAILFYEEAVVADSDNCFLWDRYAYFLLKQRRYDEALKKSDKAVQLGVTESSVWFTKGMVEARMGRIPEATRTLHKAVELGFPEHLAWVQRAYAYMNASTKDLDQIEHCLDNASRLCPPVDPRRKKHLEEVERLQVRLAQERKRSSRSSAV